MRRARARYASTPAAFEFENRDCVVRALAIAADVTYEVAHRICATHGRKPGGTTFRRTLRAAAAQLGLKPMDLGLTGGAPTKPTLAQFLRAHPTGTFAVRRAGHLFAVIDGIVHDNNRNTGPRSRITDAWRAVPLA